MTATLQSRGVSCSGAQVELEAVRPGECNGADEELRLSIAVLPLRLRIDQAVVDFCQACFGACMLQLHIVCCLWKALWASQQTKCSQQQGCNSGAGFLCATKAG